MLPKTFRGGNCSRRGRGNARGARSCVCAWYDNTRLTYQQVSARALPLP